MGLRLAIVTFAAVALSACKLAGPRVSGPIPQRGYLWQREWTEAVIEALYNAKDHFDQVIILGAEVDWAGTKPRIVRPVIDWKTINSLGKPCAVALRVAPFSKARGEGDGRVQVIRAVTKSILDEAQQNGTRITEFQLDFDCPQRELANYARWIRSVRAVAGPARFVITTLPAWLGEPDFRTLVRQVDGYVLQVHSVPTKNGESTTLCDPRLAKNWVERAARLHVPFSVALPTYRCSAGYDHNGKLISVAMDSVQPVWPPNTRVLELSANADEIAALINEWESSRPAELREVIWYRIPVSTDMRNWQWKTLATVMSGRKPLHQLKIIQEGENPCDLAITNIGQADEPVDVIITATWNGNTLVAADALPGWNVDVASNRAVFTKTPGHQPILPPGTQRKIGWLRFAQLTNLHLTLAKENEKDQ